MKLDPGMHIGMHLVSFGKSGVTVIRTEYRSQRYSMGSSDPLPAGFEIRFGCVNFQATGYGYLMRITNRTELHPWWSTGPGPIPVTPAADAPAPAQADAAGPSAPLQPRVYGKPSPPRGLLRGVFPQKIVLFFAKNSLQKRQVCFDLNFERIYAGRERPKGKEARIGDSPRLRQDKALPPHRFA
jgi:hypothetical protein